MKEIFREHKKTAVVIATVVLVLNAGTAVVAASMAGGAGVAVGDGPTGASTSGGCASGYDTRFNQLKPPDGNETHDNPPAASIRLRKPCAGAVHGFFTSEITAPTQNDFINIEMRATCIGTGQLSNPCNVGQQFFAAPGRARLAEGPTTLGTRSMNMVWPGLARGVWRFEVVPGGNPSVTSGSQLIYRTFTVEAFFGG